MSNLGLYQTTVTLMKKVGGPKNFFAFLIGASTAGGSLVTLAAQKVFKTGKRIANSKDENSEQEFPFEFTENAKEKREKVKKGDRFRVLDQDKDAIFIQIKSVPDQLFVFSENFLKNVSNYQDNEEEIENPA